ncbi:MAG: hypothetical protein NZ825_14515, partial [Candidatus Marinimicrobia bacterium]|nr:hypothetical protein [Candidatus Neomarinimicrobiota bacterium]
IVHQGGHLGDGSPISGDAKGFNSAVIGVASIGQGEDIVIHLHQEIVQSPLGIMLQDAHLGDLG